MAGQLTYVGELSIAGLCPVVVGAVAAPLAQIQAKLTGLLALSAKLTVTPPTVSAALQQTIQLAATLTLAVAVSPPAIALVTAVSAQIALLEANLQILLQLQALLGAELFVYTYAGDGAGFGPAVSARVGSGWPDGTPATAPANALVLATVSPAAWATAKTFFGGIG